MAGQGSCPGIMRIAPTTCFTIDRNNLGDPAYYSRFGFVRAAAFGLQNEYGVADEFMVLPLHETALEGVSGMVKYLPEFREAEC